jgi:ribosome-associated protein
LSNAATDHVIINERVHIPLSELRFVFSRSGGPGGQNVNKVNTRVTLLFDLSATQSLTPGQRARVQRRLRTRIDRRGVLRVVSIRHRTQAANRKAAIERFAGLLADALTVRKARLKTRVPRSAIQRRREDKTRRSRIKRLRSTRPPAED